MTSSVMRVRAPGLTSHEVSRFYEMSVYGTEARGEGNQDPLASAKYLWYRKTEMGSLKGQFPTEDTGLRFTKSIMARHARVVATAGGWGTAIPGLRRQGRALPNGHTARHTQVEEEPP